jgi:hypothetical protein
MTSLKLLNFKQIKMDTKELLKKVRKIEIKTRRLSDHIFSGNTIPHSAVE